MSYSFSASGETRAKTKRAIASELAKVVNGQPVHAADVHEAQATANALIDLLPEGPVTTSVCGSVYEVDGTVKGASIGVNVQSAS